jgi:hypothetical protein
VNNLYWGTHKQNMADRAQHGTSYKGVRNSQAKLTLANVKDIRVQRASGVTLAVLAKKYRVTVGAISMAARGDTWEHVQ